MGAGVSIPLPQNGFPFPGANHYSSVSLVCPDPFTWDYVFVCASGAPDVTGKINTVGNVISWVLDRDLRGSRASDPRLVLLNCIKVLLYSVVAGDTRLMAISWILDPDFKSLLSPAKGLWDLFSVGYPYSRGYGFGSLNPYGYGSRVWTSSESGSSDNTDADLLVSPDSATAGSAIGGRQHHSSLSLVGLGLENPPPMPYGSDFGLGLVNPPPLTCDSAHASDGLTLPTLPKMGPKKRVPEHDGGSVGAKITGAITVSGTVDNDVGSDDASFCIACAVTSDLHGSVLQ